MNTPNKLTMFRILMIFPFIAFMSISFAETQSSNSSIDYGHFSNLSTWTFFVGGLIFTIAMITDYIDGYLARKNNQVTTFGKLFDPLADKLMTTTTMVFLSLMGIIPFYLTLIFVLRDVLVDGFRNLAATKKVDVSASIYGKIKTMALSIGITLIFAIYPAFSADFGKFTPFEADYTLYLLNIIIYIATALSVISGVLYFTQVKKYINTK